MHVRIVTEKVKLAVASVPFVVCLSRVRARVGVVTHENVRRGMRSSPPGLVLARRQPISPKIGKVVLCTK